MLELNVTGVALRAAASRGASISDYKSIGYEVGGADHCLNVLMRQYGRYERFKRSDPPGTGRAKLRLRGRLPDPSGRGHGGGRHPGRAAARAPVPPPVPRRLCPQDVAL